MKMKLNKFIAIISLCTLAVLPLPAQTGVTNAAVTNLAAPVVEDLQNAQPVRAHAAGFLDEGFTQNLALMIPIVAIVMGCSIPIVIVGLQLYFRHRKNQMLHETVRAMVEKGVPIPPELLNRPEPREFMEHDKPKRRNDLLTGLIFMGIGIGMVMLTGKAGFIVLFMGVAFVAYSFLEKKNNNDGSAPKP